MSQMTIVEIDVTTRCPHQCSGCTRMVGHVPVRDMDLDTFELAVDSLEDHPGMIAIIGGEPLLWPHIDVATDYLVARTGGPNKKPAHCAPVPDLTKFLLENYSDVCVRRGLFTSLPPSTIYHWEKILESYQFIGFNTHENAGQHQQFLVAGNELPIPQKQRLQMIQDCWVNKYWSCSITPQGCWPCEIMGSLAHAFDGPGPKQGWPIERDWWRRPPSDWNDMLKWCEICGAAMDVPRLLATDDHEIVSPANYDRLEKIGSKKIARGIVEKLDVASYDPTRYAARKHNEWYLPSTSDNQPASPSRIRSTSHHLRPRRLECVMVCVGYSDYLEITLPWNIRHWDKTVVVTSPEDSQTTEVAKKYGAQVVTSNNYQARNASFNKGAMLNAGVTALDYDDWVMFTDADILLPPNFRETFNQNVWNPGVLYSATRVHTPTGDLLQWIDKYKNNPSLADSLLILNPFADQDAWGYFQLFHSAATSLRNRGRDLYSEDFLSAGGVDKHFMELWPPDKQHLTCFEVIHIDHGSHTLNWSGRRSPPLVLTPLTGIVPNNGWTAMGWLDDSGYHHTLKLETSGFVKLYRSDTGESIVVENKPLPEGNLVLDDDLRFGARHGGIATTDHEVVVSPANRGKIIVHQADGRSYSGWGLGHALLDEDRQGYVWNGIEIDKINFEILHKPTLSAEDVEHLLRPRSQH
jgi:hypothetical protein